ncbi:related to BCS1 protein precursor [Serendipita indica DSM 11827]|uniref:Related to BCS1 protein n=1 Tax=Serendipita indica (strain DSM 11827) TaxID=1109443 RepID=G4THG6_SERID|nr:related to BCS1 protein precursor [Serendipita indica DSM 11827]
MEALGKLLSPLSMGTSAVQDTVKLVVIGGTVETARRISGSAWSNFVDSFFLTAHFSEDDVLMHWLSKQPAFGKSREFDITTRSVGRNNMDKTAGDIEDDEEDGEQFSHGKRKKKVVFMPCHDTTHNIYYGGHLLRVTRSKRNSEYGATQEIKISVVARSNDVIKRLVLEAKKLYEADAEHRIHIYLADTYGYWRYNGSRQKRPLSSIVLEPGVKDMIVADCKDFLRSEDWYAERGIPYRRGYLLHGVPGSGKTSLIHALAGELGLDIYVVSLSAKGMNDTMLMNLMGRIPQRCILLLEDLDAAFTRSVTRDATSTGVPMSSKSTSSTNTTESDGNSLSLSGLLNALDGVAASEGRLLFATTNHIDRLDEALRRPGRMDVWINFKYATKWQAEGIFKCFFPSREATAAAAAEDLKNAEAQGKEPPKRKVYTTIPLLSADELVVLAKQFAEAIPENELSVAGLQGYLLKNKSRPRECVAEAAEWVRTERETRERIKKEKEEREAKEREEALEKKKKEDAKKATTDDESKSEDKPRSIKKKQIVQIAAPEVTETAAALENAIKTDASTEGKTVTPGSPAVDVVDSDDLVILSALTTASATLASHEDSSKAAEKKAEEIETKVTSGTEETTSTSTESAS